MALIDYTRHGDYFLPNIILDEPPSELTEPITKYGAMRRSYLKEHHLIIYKWHRMGGAHDRNSAYSRKNDLDMVVYA